MTIYILAYWRYDPEIETEVIVDIGSSTQLAPQGDNFSIIDTAETDTEAKDKLRWYRQLHLYRVGDE